MIRTAIPFGYLFILLFVISSLLIGFAIVVFSFFKKSKPFRWFCVLSYLAYVVLIIIGVVINVTGEPEWNPVIKNDAEVAGVWTDSQHKLKLTADHHFTYRDHDVVTSGTWSRDDWNLYLKSGAPDSHGAPTNLRFIEYKGHYRVLTKLLLDTDEWDGDYGLNKD